MLSLVGLFRATSPNEWFLYHQAQPTRRERPEPDLLVGLGIQRFEMLHNIGDVAEEGERCLR